MTDLPIDDGIRQLPIVFEQALPLWGKEFAVPESQWKEAKVTAYLMLHRDRFVELKLIPVDSSHFRNGYQLEDRLYLLEQPSAYYRRHLLLHEATHWYLWKFLGGNGPPWFSEGQCERMGTHRWDGNQLTLGVLPSTTEEVPYWGRIKVIRDDVKQGIAPSLSSIFKYSDTAHRADSPYAWSWAAVTFFSNHPRYGDSFRKLIKPPLDYSNALTQSWTEVLHDERNLVETEWQIFREELDYGFDLERSIVNLKAPLIARSPNHSVLKVVVAADRGWQATGIRLKSNQSVKIQARGKIRVRQAKESANEPDWLSEPQGITLEYCQGYPLGALVGMFVPDAAPGDREEKLESKLTHMLVGSAAQQRSTADSQLLLKINERSSQLLDNLGSYEVEISVTEQLD